MTDWATLQKIGKEVAAVQKRAGVITYEQWKKWWTKALGAVGGQGEYLEFLLNVMEPSWMKRLTAETTKAGVQGAGGYPRVGMGVGIGQNSRHKRRIELYRSHQG
jgi:hypothetical protein